VVFRGHSRYLPAIGTGGPVKGKVVSVVRRQFHGRGVRLPGHEVVAYSGHPLHRPLEHVCGNNGYHFYRRIDGFFHLFYILGRYPYGVIQISGREERSLYYVRSLVVLYQIRSRYGEGILFHSFKVVTRKRFQGDGRLIDLVRPELASVGLPYHRPLELVVRDNRSRLVLSCYRYIYVYFAYGDGIPAAARAPPVGGAGRKG